jgi:hypothetical protein
MEIKMKLKIEVLFLYDYKTNLEGKGRSLCSPLYLVTDSKLIVKYLKCRLTAFHLNVQLETVIRKTKM